MSNIIEKKQELKAEENVPSQYGLRPANRGLTTVLEASVSGEEKKKLLVLGIFHCSDSNLTNASICGSNRRIFQIGL
ncbi:hypothetical protein SUGI_0056230 [Cryptomeria japonica]|nr:hypothetical protein SUGI_0056230 [Cryptomeria japonica]